MRRTPTLPKPLTATLAPILARHNSHSSIDVAFQRHGAPGEPPSGNKVDKCMLWLDRAAVDEACDALALAGGLIYDFMEGEGPDDNPYDEFARRAVEQWQKDKETITAALARHGLSYITGGHLVRGGTTGIATRSLDDTLRAGDFPGVETEFQRAVQAVEADPAAALTAACAILEALFKIIIHDDKLSKPSKKETLAPLWATVRDHLGFDPGSKDDDDVKRILQGLASIVDGIGALRTHAGSAHGRDSRKAYRVEPRHARLAIHAAHTLVVFVIETWKRHPRRPA